MGCLVLDMFQLCSWKICEQDLPLARGLSANMFGKISDGQVDQIRSFVPKNCELSFVGRYYDWNYRPASPLCQFLEFLL